MIASKNELFAVLRQYNPWWDGGRVPDLPSWRRVAFPQLLESLGDVTILASRATDAFLLGAPDGFLLQEPGRVNVDFGPGVTIHIVPEPPTAVMLLTIVCTGIAAKKWRRS